MGRGPSVALKRRYFDVGAIARVGRARPARALRRLAQRRRRGARHPAGGRRLGAWCVDLGPLPRPYAPHRIARVNLLLGVRDIRFVRRDGRSTRSPRRRTCRSACSSARRSAAASTMLGAQEEDFFLAGDLYVGLSRSAARDDAAAAAGRGAARARRRRRGTACSPRAGSRTSVKVEPRRTSTQLVLEWAGGYRQRTPFQLLLGVPEGGVRGYEKSTFAGRPAHRGARRAPVLVRRRAQARATLGFAVFADAGRQWAGDVPFGVTTPVKASLGIEPARGGAAAIGAALARRPRVPA